MKNNHTRAKRGEVKGWAKTASRNNTKFLRSVYVPDLTGAAVAFTLTIRDCPPTSDDWKILRETFISVFAALVWFVFTGSLNGRNEASLTCMGLR
ncbi:hypothetical protein, partial [Escherichia coli]|uniref:hypothetical protein n=2 Tax=Escherichia coli TaxID=562 RepID=UPI001BC8738C